MKSAYETRPAPPVPYEYKAGSEWVPWARIVNPLGAHSYSARLTVLGEVTLIQKALGMADAGGIIGPKTRQAVQRAERALEYCRRAGVDLDKDPG